ncbi:transposase domain-containing protein [Streptomyces atroolivaceus]|uniref:transposase domain-containing protein n=1 Tax=Streptomyces atroolivaceus TaxID=66869 RepID=UPI00363E173C
MPFEMVDEVLATTRAVQRRVRLVPARVTVYLLLAGALFAELGYRQVFDRLCAGLAGQAERQRVVAGPPATGAAPLRALFDLVRGPVATVAAQTRWRGLLVVAVDGTLLSVPDAPENLTIFAKNRFAATGADLLVRCKSGRRLPPVARCRDGSFLARLGTLTVRVIDAEISIVTSQGSRTGHYRLLTTLTDPAEHPAAELIRLYHERWEIETAYAELKSTILGGRVLRARTPAGVEQEVWALLVAYQALRTAMTDATDSLPGTDPDRAGFTVALSAARDQLVLAAGVIADTVVDLVGVIGRHVLAQLLPKRRVRTKDRIVKRAISKYNARGPAIDRASYKATISIHILTTPLTPPGPPQLNGVASSTATVLAVTGGQVGRWCGYGWGPC